MVADLSEEGARVKTDAEIGMGTQVDLRINKYNDLRSAHVVWIRGKEIGLEFEVSIDKSDGEMKRLFDIVK